MTTPTLYGPQFSYFVRAVSLLFEFKGLPYIVSRSPFGEEIPLFGEEHGTLHPFRKLPVLVQDDLILPESLAIARYIETLPGPSFMPGDAKQQAMIIAAACMISQYVHLPIVPNMLLEFRFPKGKEGKIRFDVIEENIPKAESALLWLVGQLGDRSYIVGDQFTLADAYLVPMLDYLDRLPEPYDLNRQHDSLCRYIQFHREQAYSEKVLL